MKVDVYLYATLSSYLPEDASGRSVTLEVSEGASIREIVELLNIPKETIKLLFVNGIHAQMDTILGEGDRLGVFPPVGGG